MLAPEIGRASGFPNWYAQTGGGRNPAKVRDASRYYDPVNFARAIRCPVLMAGALQDDLAPPSSVLAALNAITARKEFLLLPRAGHYEENGSHRTYDNRAYDDWLPALRQGRPAPVRDHDRWVGTWATSAQAVEPALLPPDAPKLSDVTIRQVVRASIGGRRLRVRLSNQFASAGNPLRVTGATIALSAGAAAIKPGTLKPLAFDGRPSVTILPGALTLSDPVDFDFPPGADLAVTLHVASEVKEITGHRAARCDAFLQAGDAVAAPNLESPVTMKIWLCLCGVDTLGPPDTAAVICLGDSLTDGRGSTEGENRRWPDILSRRLRENPPTAGVGVLNQGIGGNSVTRGGIGQPALARLGRDVLAQPGARWLIVYEGANDLGGGATTDEIIAAYRQIIARARDRGLRVYGATLTPAGGSFYDKPGDTSGETARQRVNAWMRSSRAFDAVLDFDAIVRDPSDPSRLLPAADSGDHLHLNDEGYRMLAESINLDLFKTQ
jgi:lysophospholipase L1-like esterase